MNELTTLSNERIYYVQDGPTQYGPHSEVEIAQLVQSGQVAPTAMICQNGWPSWAMMPVAIAAMAPQQSAADALAASIPRTRTHQVQVTSSSSRKSPPRSLHHRSPFGIAFGLTMGFLVALVAYGFATGFFGSFMTAVHPTVTRAAYDQISVGMSYEKALSIVGTAPTQSNAEEMRGFGEIVPTVNAADYVWRNADGSGMGIVVLNGQVTYKAQKNLR